MSTRRGIKLLFDVTKLYKTDNYGFYRSGIFWVTYNILKRFIQDSRFEITLFSEFTYPKINFDMVDIDISQIPYVSQKYSINAGKVKKTLFNKSFCVEHYDAYFNSAFFSKLEAENVKQFYLLHDAIPMILSDKYPQKFVNNFKEFYDNILPSTYCFCISESCKNDFLKFFTHLDPNNFKIVYNASSQNFGLRNDVSLFNQIVNKYNLPLKNNDKYIFTISNLADEKKNLVFTLVCFMKLLDEYKISNLYFVLAGYGHTYLQQKLNEAYPSLYEKYKNRIIFLGYVDDDDVNVMYSNALFFSFISLYEGFGLPLIEAMQCGTPVLTSNVSSIPEVVDDSAVCVSPTDETECIKKMFLLYSDSQLREKLISKGVKRAKFFSWDKTYKLISDKIYYSIFSNNKKKGN